MTTGEKKTYKIGLTGGIASGKSVVRKILDAAGVPTIDADEIVHDILQQDKQIIAQIIDMFGPHILNDDGGINRKELAKIVFYDPEDLKTLEGIIHPHTYRIIKDFIAETSADIVAVVIPLLFENHRQHMFDAVWLVTTDEQTQIDRLKLRDAMPEEEARQRIAAQMPQNLKMAMADVVIDNSGTIESLQSAVELQLELIRQSNCISP